MTTEQTPSPAPEPQGAVQAQQQNQPGQHTQGQGQGHRRRRRRRNKNKSQQQNGAPQQNGQPAQAPAAQHQGQQKQKSGKRFFQKSPGNQGNYNGNGFRPMPGNSNGNGGGGRRKNKGRRQQVFVGPMDHSYRVANGNVADSSHHQQNNGEFRGVPHSGFYSEADFYPPVPMREDAPTRIYCFIEDLFFLAKIQEVSKKLGIKVAFLKPEKDDKDKDVVTKLTEIREEDRPALILFDLNSSNTKPLTLIPKIRTKLKRSASIIGFLSHIQGDLKNKALEAGCDTVMPRATFSQNLPGLLRRYGIEEEAEDEYQAIQA